MQVSLYVRACVQVSLRVKSVHAVCITATVYQCTCLVYACMSINCGCTVMSAHALHYYFIIYYYFIEYQTEPPSHAHLSM